jgi:hypothetical protein
MKFLKKSSCHLTPIKLIEVFDVLASVGRFPPFTTSKSYRSRFTISTTSKAFGLMFTTFETPLTNYLPLSNSIFSLDFEPFSTNYVGVDILWFDDGSNMYLQLSKFVVFSQVPKMNGNVQLLANCYSLTILSNFDNFEALLVIDVYGNHVFFSNDVIVFTIDYDVVPTIDDEYVIDEGSKFKYFLC